MTDPQPTGPASTRAFIHFLVRSYPAETVRTSVLIALSTAAEAMGVVTLIPTLNTAINSGAPPPVDDGLSRSLATLLGWLGLPYTLPALVVLIAGLMTLKGLFQWLALRAGGRAMAQIAADFRLGLVGNLFRARWSFFTQQRIGDLAGGIGHEAYSTAHAYLAMCQMFAAGAVALLYLAAITVLSPPALVLTLVVGLMLMAPLQLMMRYVRRTATTEARSQRNFVTNLLNAIQSIKPIRAMGREESFEALARSDAEQLRTSISRQVSAGYLVPAVQEPVLVLGISVFLAGGSRFLQLDFPTLAIVVFALWRAGIHFSFANRSYRELVIAEPHYRQLRTLLDRSRRACEDDTGIRPVPPARLAIALEDIGFAHGADRILDGLSIQIPAGSITALIGESGVGKTTVIDLLLALHRPAEGRILVNGVPLDEISTRAWRGQLGYVPQEAHLFHGTVFENLTMGDPLVSEDDVRAALVAAGAWAFVEALDAGIHTTVGEQGGQLSGGQRQRLAIARALARRPLLLLLDEFTASLDPQTESAVIATIKGQRPGVTVVIATHQQALIDIADQVYRLHDKRATLVVSRGQAIVP